MAVILTAAAVLLGWHTPLYAQDDASGPCRGVTEKRLDDWIRKANNGAAVTETLRPHGACTVDVDADGLEVLTGRLALTAAGPGSLTLRGGDSLFDVGDRGSLQLSGFMLTGATSSAVTVATGGSFTAERMRFTGNTGHFGGAVANLGGTVAVNDSDVYRNTASYSAAGLGNNGYSAVMTVSNTRITENRAPLAAGMFNTNGQVTVISGVVVGNVAELGAGAGLVNGGGSMTVLDTEIRANRLVCPPGVALCGGGLANAGILQVVNCKVTDNTSTGVANLGGGTTLITDSEITGNTTADSGGGVTNGSGGSVTVVNSTISGNIATGAGGGVADTAGGVVKLVNTTVRGNRSGVPGGGVANTGGGVVTMTNSTATGNNPDNCAGAVDGCG
ncbi:hypothetical protein F4560_002213 [Saccharothrix ecbatanensis]|uniref:Outer membrane repeat protein n=1 Tax=Saccharothrix ecbatanensis TaxID=1105145 RepID=A0A7W9HHV0_9PSEU|nr:hypothetical protein [Saccharothrix ecbatanensis]